MRSICLSTVYPILELAGCLPKKKSPEALVRAPGPFLTGKKFI
jgi:hypothetical protein